MRQERQPAVVAPLADHESGDHRGDAGIDVHHRAAGEVERAELRQEAAAPDPMRHRGVNRQRPGHDEGEVGGKAHPFGDRAGNERRGDDREGTLKGHEKQVRNGALSLEADPAQKGVGEPADEAVAGSEGQAVAEQGPGDADRAQGGEAHHHGVERVFGADQAAVEKRQRRGHQEDHGGGDDHPGGIRRRDRWSGKRAIHLFARLSVRRDHDRDGGRLSGACRSASTAPAKFRQDATNR